MLCFVGILPFFGNRKQQRYGSDTRKAPRKKGAVLAGDNASEASRHAPTSNGSHGSLGETEDGTTDGDLSHEEDGLHMNGNGHTNGDVPQEVELATIEA